MIKSVSIRTALISLGILAAMIGFSLMTMTYLAQVESDKNDQVKSKLLELRVILDEIESSVLSTRIAEQDFLLHPEDSDAGQIDALMGKITQLVSSATQTMGDAPEHAENKAVLRQMGSAVAALLTQFQTVTSSARSLGYGGGDGLGGDGLGGAWNSARDALIASVRKGSPQPELQAKLLTLLEHEGQFLRSGAEADKAALDASLTEFRSFPISFYTSFDQKRAIAALLIPYQSALTAYRAEMTQQENLRADARAGFNAIIPLLAQMHANFDTANTAFEARMNASKMWLRLVELAFTLTAIVVFLILSFWVALLIARPLRAIGSALDRMRDGDYTMQLRQSRISETNIVAAAFEDFRSDLATRKGLEDEVNSVIAACAQGDFSRRIDMGDQAQASSGLVAGVNAIGEAAQKGIGDVLAVIEALSQGDLTQRMAPGHQGMFLRISTAVDVLVHNLSQTLADMTQTSETLTRTSQQIVGASQIASQRGQTSAASLEQTAAALQQLSSTVKDTANSAGAAEDFVGGAQSRTQEAFSLAGEAGAAIERIRDSSKAISSIVDLIEDVAFQTNLLALNAGVEAARAGDAGLGFAVVASEVRNLALRVTEAAGEISRLVRSSEKDVRDGVDLMAKSSASLASIRDTVGHIVARVVEIAKNTEGQANGITEINIAVTALDKDVQTNVASLDETVDAGEALRAEAQRLGDLVRRFRLSDPAPRGHLAIAAE